MKQKAIDINQGKIIANLNKYLDWHNLPIRVDRRGICNGLVAVSAKYKLEGRQSEFLRILNRIAGMTSQEELDSEVNHFVTQIVLSADPRLFNRAWNQYKAIEMVQIDNKSLKASFEVGLVTDDQNWGTIIKEISLENDEIMLVRGMNHAISISKENGQYVVYDPNYKLGFKTFSSEQSLVKELHNKVFKQARQLGMSLQVIRPSSKIETPRKFPDVDIMYQKYLMPNQTAILKNDPNLYNNLYFAIHSNSKTILKQLFTNGFIDDNPRKSVITAINESSVDILGELLSRYHEDDLAKIESVLIHALRCGNEAAFNELLKDQKYKDCFYKWGMLKTHAGLWIYSATEGGNPALQQRLFDEYKKNGNPDLLSDQDIASSILEPRPFDAIEEAIYGGTQSTCVPSDCLQVLLSQLKTAKYKLADKKLLSYLLHAVHTNQPHKVNLLVEYIKTSTSEESQKHIFQSIVMSTRAVAKTDISILRKLQDCHVPFSKEAKGVIAQKENKPIGYLLPIGIMLSKFTDFIKAKLGHHEAKNSFNKFNFFKRQIAEIREPSAAERNTESTPLLTSKKR